MRPVRRTLRFARGALLAYGPSFTKRFLWDGEYSQGKWDFIDHTAGDCVYPYLEKYARGGSILDLGCGPGNTASELPATAYTSYLGVDISDVCLEKARRRSEAEGRSDKNAFAPGDLLTYAPSRVRGDPPQGIPISHPDEEDTRHPAQVLAIPHAGWRLHH